MTDLSPGQEVTVSGMAGGRATVVRVDGDMVRLNRGGKERTVPLSRVTPKRESKALSEVQLSAETMAKLDMLAEDAIAHTASPLRSDEKRRAVLRDEPLPTLGASRPVPKPVTLTSPAYLAYVRKHPCCLCGASGPSEPHHWSHHGGVMGAKVDDYRTVPLCTEHHRHWHDHGMLPGMDRVGSEDFFLWEQRVLLTAWLGQTTSRALDGAMVDALIRAIGGADA